MHRLWEKRVSSMCHANLDHPADFSQASLRGGKQSLSDVPYAQMSEQGIICEKRQQLTANAKSIPHQHFTFSRDRRY